MIRKYSMRPGVGRQRPNVKIGVEKAFNNNAKPSLFVCLFTPIHFMYVYIYIVHVGNGKIDKTWMGAIFSCWGNGKGKTGGIYHIFGSRSNRVLIKAVRLSHIASGSLVRPFPLVVSPFGKNCKKAW